MHSAASLQAARARYTDTKGTRGALFGGVVGAEHAEVAVRVVTEVAQRVLGACVAALEQLLRSLHHEAAVRVVHRPAAGHVWLAPVRNVLAVVDFGGLAGRDLAFCRGRR